VSKYLTYFGLKNKVNIYDTLGEFVPSTTALTKIETYLGLMTVCKLEENIDLSYIPEESINFFGIKIHDINTLRQYLREISDYAIMENTLSKDSFSIYGPWKFNELTDHIYPDQKPYDNWIWDEQTGNWTPPIVKPNMDNIFDVDWDQSTGQWAIKLKQDCSRRYRGFVLWKAVPKITDDFYEKACTTTEYMSKPFESITHNTSQHEAIIRSDHNKDSLKQKSINSEHVSASLYRIVKQHNMLLDFTPFMLITYSEMEEDFINSYEEGKNPLITMHPQCMAYTLQELFRLIIEWAWSYRQCGNIEPIAVHCDTLLRQLQMPLNVRKDLLDIVPDQAVSKYIKGDIEAVTPAKNDPECPKSFSDWMASIYVKYKRRNIGDPLNLVLDNLPEYYPV